MTDIFLGEIRVFPFNFAPAGWAQCNGQVLPTFQNVGLYALLGNMYGGEPDVTFALPDLRGSTAIHAGQGVGLSDRAVGQSGGANSVALVPSQIPSHTHTVAASASAGTTPQPSGGDWAVPRAKLYGTNVGSDANGVAIGVVGGSGHDNRPPYLVLNYCIALLGIFPSR